MSTKSTTPKRSPAGHNGTIQTLATIAAVAQTALLLIRLYDAIKLRMPKPPGAR